MPLWEPGGGHNGFGRRSIFYFSRFSAPIPPTPFPAGRGRPRLFHARGSAPCIPATEPARHWEMGANQAPGGGHGGFACRIALPLWVPGGGHNGFGRRSIFYFSRFSAPIPPTPFPAGRGGSRLFHARGCAPCIPGIKPFAALIDFVAVVPCGGACLVCRPPTVPFACFPAPIPPNPLPGGKGGNQGYFMQGAAPLASPRLNPRGTGSTCQSGTRRGARRFCLPDCFATVGARRGGTMVLVAGRFFTLAVFLPPFPEGEGYPPDPLPGGKGETLGYFMQGAAPLASPRLNPRGTYIPCQAGAQRRGELVFRRKTDRTAFLWAVPPAKERGDRGRGTSAFEMVLSPGAGRTSAAGVQPPPKPLLPIIFRPSLDNRTEVWYTRDTTIETR